MHWAAATRLADELLALTSSNRLRRHHESVLHHHPTGSVQPEKLTADKDNTAAGVHRAACAIMSLIRIKRRQFAALKHTNPRLCLYLFHVQICSSCDLDWQLSLQLQMDDSRLFVRLKTVGLFFPLPFSFPLNTAQGWIIRGRGPQVSSRPRNNTAV